MYFRRAAENYKNDWMSVFQEKKGNLRGIHNNVYYTVLHFSV